MGLSLGWLLLLGGILGGARVLFAKTFSWQNTVDGVAEEERKNEVPMTPVRRSILMAICTTAALVGVFLLSTK
jgi:hypothetical protein